METVSKQTARSPRTPALGMIVNPRFCVLVSTKVETATLRLVALRMFPNVNQAAERLGMARMSLASWIGRRKLPMAVET